jgi:hypothetical protein
MIERILVVRGPGFESGMVQVTRQLIGGGPWGRRPECMALCFREGRDTHVGHCPAKDLRQDLFVTWNLDPQEADELTRQLVKVML